MRRAAAAALLLLSAASGAAFLDAVVARVDQSVVTWSQVVQEASLRRLTGDPDQVSDARGVAQALVRRRLLVAEARKMRLEVAPGEVEAGVEALVASAGGAQAFWPRARRLGLSEADLDRRAGDLALMRRYLDLRRDMTYVPEAEVRSFYSSQAEVLGERPLAEVRDEVRAFLARKKQQQQLDEWIARQVAEGRVRLVEPSGGWPALPPLP